ncbi:MAG: hypothetical protein U5K29_03565 [Acidimicrobiales bacterium]|nr:hypothetical protein [Acidimicrobiales bacterium]
MSENGQPDQPAATEPDRGSAPPPAPAARPEREETSGEGSGPAARTTASGAAAALTGDWPAQATDAVVDLVGTVRDRAVEPLLKVARAIVYGLLITVVAITAVVLVVILAIRMLDAYLPGEVWSAYLLLGGVFILAGFICWSRRTVRAT